MLAGGYARLTRTGVSASRIRDPADQRDDRGVIKMGEFIDADEEFIEGGEVQVGAFGGAMTREILGALGMANRRFARSPPPILRGRNR